MKQNLFFTLIICLFLLTGCQKPIENNKADLFPTDREYHIKMKADGFEGGAKIFFDAEKNFHLVHTDESSPLFGMEEVYSGGKTNFHFGDLSRQEDTRCQGTALAYYALDLIAEKSPQKTESGALEEKEALICIFSESDKTAKLFLSKSDHAPLQIIGDEALSGLEIHFLQMEQN